METRKDSNYESDDYSDKLNDDEKMYHRNAEILRMMPDNIAGALAKARSKPIWCSDVRWRMELKRRRSSRFGF